MRISKVSEKYNISTDTLRYYERIGLVPPVNRNQSGIRDYTEEDLKWLEFSTCMRSAGLSIKVLIEYLNLFEQGDSTIEARKALLIDQRSTLSMKIDEMKTTLERLDMKIDFYEKKLPGFERSLNGYEE